MPGADQEQNSRALPHQGLGLPTRMSPVAQQTLVGLWSPAHKGSSLGFEQVPDPLCTNLNTDFRREGMGKGNKQFFFFLYDSSFKSFF